MTQPEAAPVIPDPAATPPPAPGDTLDGGLLVTDTGQVVIPQPMPPAGDGYVNLATVPPVVSLTIPPATDGDPTVVITDYGTLVDAATATRAYSAATTGGFNLREL